MVCKPVDVVGIGAIAWDRFIVVPRFPKPDEKLRAIHSEECAGGTVATALVALHRWGLECRVVGALGGDSYSHRILADLDEEGVDTSCVVRDREAEGRRSTILVDHRNGQRCVLSGPHRLPPLRSESLPADLFNGARVLHLDSSVDECSVEVVKLARAAGLWVTIDAERVTPQTEELLPLCDCVIASMAFAREWTEQEKLSLAAYGVFLKCGRPTIVTDGANGCEYVADGVQFSQPACSVPVVDGTGAGDVFHAAYIYGLLAAWEPRRIVRFACWAAAQTCRELGGRKGIPTLDAVKDFLHHDRANGG